ncbi:hypothetical protein LRS11_18455 [Pseudomonas sp. J452]|uniref:hypothetical protein n=1 Tax=Pseudomonas sp. J452 TaxID=2898441 RepID=UPI0021AD81AA|nr:hypothetical protein [Pseudomonas sp. J452]UUY07772.1 hypothetical protein LRS11_18455 [Pseudomonas sp. J452]
MSSDEQKIALYRRVNGFTGPLARSAWHWRTRWLARLLASFIWHKNRGRPQQGTLGSVPVSFTAATEPVFARG